MDDNIVAAYDKLKCFAAVLPASPFYGTKQLRLSRPPTVYPLNVRRYR